MPSRPTEARSFLESGWRAQLRYERLRTYVLDHADPHRRRSPAQFDLQRFKRFGLLGLVEGEPRRSPLGDWEIQVVPLGANDAEDRLCRLYALLADLITQDPGDADATCRPLRPGLDRAAGEGADDPEPAGGHYALR
ncbi:MAG: hypothetical protein ACE5MI_13940 [Acidimicrobiia bacterium]